MCQEALGAELAMLPCGHQLCVRCQMALIDRLPGNLPRVRDRGARDKRSGFAPLCGGTAKYPAATRAVSERR